MRLKRVVFGAFFVLVAGCAGSTGPEEVPPTKYDAASIARAALQELDKNKNGAIEGAELDASPALRAALSAIDKNKDGRLSASEIQGRVEEFARRDVFSVICSVTLDKQPLVGAAVSFEPEKFMSESLKTATSTTDKDGLCSSFEIDGQSFPSLPAGFYRIRVTKGGMNIPPRFNTQTTLGAEVWTDPRSGGDFIELKLTSR